MKSVKTITFVLFCSLFLLLNSGHVSATNYNADDYNNASDYSTSAPSPNETTTTTTPTNTESTGTTSVVPATTNSNDTSANEPTTSDTTIDQKASTTNKNTDLIYLIAAIFLILCIEFYLKYRKAKANK